jgi:hypothetical protein
MFEIGTEAEKKEVCLYVLFAQYYAVVLFKFIS